MLFPYWIHCNSKPPFILLLLLRFTTRTGPDTFFTWMEPGTTANLEDDPLRRIAALEDGLGVRLFDRLREVVRQGGQIHDQYEKEFDNGVTVGWHRVPWINGCMGMWTEQARALYELPLTHGTTLHGIQNLEPGLETVPTSYYARRSGVGQVLANAPALFGPAVLTLEKPADLRDDVIDVSVDDGLLARAALPRRELAGRDDLVPAAGIH